MKPNTVFLGFKTNWKDSINKENSGEVGNFDETKTTKNYVNVVQDAFDQQLGVAIFRSNFSHTENEKKAKRILNEKREGTIDVWWLFDDGGLTLLIPYLLSLNRYWKKCKLRVFTPSVQKGSEISSRQIHMANLLKKFRIHVSCVEEFEGISDRPSDENVQEFEDLVGHAVDKEHKKKSLRHIRLGELLKQHSKDASLIVMTLPVPNEAVEPSMYMSWLEMMTKDLPPILLIRGNHTNVLTFYT